MMSKSAFPGGSLWIGSEPKDFTCAINGCAADRILWRRRAPVWERQKYNRWFGKKRDSQVGESTWLDLAVNDLEFDA